MEENKETKKTTTKKQNSAKKTSSAKATTKTNQVKNNKNQSNSKKPNNSNKKSTAKKNTSSKSNNPKVKEEKNQKEIIVESTMVSESKPKADIESTLIFEGIPKNERKTDNLEKTIIFDGEEKKNIADVVKKLEEENVVVENKVVKRSKVKKVIIIILALIMIALIAGTVYYVIDSQKIAQENSLTIGSDIYKKVTRNYKSVSEINKKSEAKNKIKDFEYSNIKTLTVGEFEEKAYNKEDMVVIVSSATCYSCLTFEPVLNETLAKLEKTIYRINITNLTTKEKDLFRTYYAFTATPTMFKVVDGKVTADYKGTMSAEEITNWLK